MARLISFIHSAQEIAEFQNDFPEHDFTPVSQNAFPGLWAVLRENDFEKTIEALAVEHARRPFAGIVFGSDLELYVKAADRIARALGLRRFVSDAEVVRDKFLMRQALSVKVACPRTRLVCAGEDAASWPDLEFPCVLKPRHGLGSVCVFKAGNRRDLAAAQRGLQAATAFLSSRYPLAIPSDDMLLEDFVGGTEHTVEMFLVDGRAVLEVVSDKLPMEVPYFIETGDVMPSRLPPEDIPMIKEAARGAAAAVGMQWGWAHVEIKWAAGVAYVIEIAARPGGGYTRAMLRTAYNIDPRAVLIDAHLGKPPVQPLAAVNTVFGKNVVSEGLELVFSITGLDAARQCVGFLEMKNRFTGVPRVFLGPPLSFNSTILSFFVFDSSQERAVELFKNLDGLIKVRRFRLPFPSPTLLVPLFAALSLAKRRS